MTDEECVNLETAMAGIICQGSECFVKPTMDFQPTQLVCSGSYMVSKKALDLASYHRWAMRPCQSHPLLLASISSSTKQGD